MQNENTKIKNQVVRDILLILLVNFVVHGLMILVTGHWWDDYLYVIEDSMRIVKERSLQMGRPITYYMLLGIYGLPIGIFRMLVVVLHSGISVLIYLIFRKISIPRRSSLLIVMLYIAVPINDSRILKCVYPYTLTLFLFWIATYILISILSMKKGKVRNLFRVISLVLFFVAFDTASLMFYYLIPFLYVWYFEVKELIKNRAISWKNIIFGFLKYIDYYCVPFVFVIVKNIFFVPYGQYEEYNSVTLSNLFDAIKNIFLWGFQEGLFGLYNWEILRSGWMIVIVIVALILSFIICRIYKNSLEEEKLNRFYYLLGTLFGVGVFLIGLFPYAVVRGGVVATTAVGGRDAVLLGLGVAIICYCLGEIISFSDYFLKFLIIVFVLCGSAHFSGWYITYQEDYYEEIALQQFWLETEEVEKGVNFIHIDKNERKSIGGLRDYSLNQMAWELYGVQSRFFAVGVEDLSFFIEGGKRSIQEKYKEIEKMEEYDFDNYTIDGVEEYKFDMSYMEIIKMKVLEIFDEENFKKQVKEYGTYEYLPISNEISQKILEAYKKGELIKNEDLYSIIK